MKTFDRPNPLDKGMPIIPADARSECLFKTASEIEAERLQKKELTSGSQPMALLRDTAKDRDDAVKQALEVGAAAAQAHLQAKGWSGERTAAAILGLGVNLNGAR